MLIQTLEQESIAPQPEALPNTQQFQQLLADELATGVPEELRECLPGEQASQLPVWVFDPELHATELNEDQQATIRNLYVRQTAMNLKQDSWWSQTAIGLRNKGIDKETMGRLIKLRQAYEIQVFTPEGIQGAYEVFECGSSEDAELSEKELDAITETVKLIDQFSGGALLSQPGTRRIVTVGGERMAHPHSDQEDIAGFAGETATVINISEARREAAEHGIKPAILIGAILVHEMLGHQLEYLSEKDLGGNFLESFVYSGTRKPGKLFKTIHESITPKDRTKTGSTPVSEYGWVDRYEDVATSIGALVEHSMQWEDQLKKSERFTGTPDEYRSELVTQLFDEVAQRIAATESSKGAHGFVGSPVIYTEGPDGLGVLPGRTFIRTLKTVEQVVKEEAQRLTEPFKHQTEILYRVLEDKSPV